MPELTPSQRAAGPWVGQGDAGGRHYPPDTLGPLCWCGWRIPAALQVDEHPTCGPDFRRLVAQSRRALGTRRASTPTEGSTP